MFPGPSDFERQQMALSLEEPGCKSPNLVQRLGEAGEAEYGTVIVLQVRPFDIRADMTEFVQIGNIGHCEPLAEFRI